MRRSQRNYKSESDSVSSSSLEDNDNQECPLFTTGDEVDISVPIVQPSNVGISNESEDRATKEATAGGNVTSDGTNVSHKSVDADDKLRYISSVTKRIGSNFGKPPASVSTSTRKHRRSSSDDDPTYSPSKEGNIHVKKHQQKRQKNLVAVENYTDEAAALQSSNKLPNETPQCNLTTDDDPTYSPSREGNIHAKKHQQKRQKNLVADENYTGKAAALQSSNKLPNETPQCNLTTNQYIRSKITVSPGGTRKEVPAATQSGPVTQCDDGSIILSTGRSNPHRLRNLTINVTKLVLDGEVEDDDGTPIVESLDTNELTNEDVQKMREYLNKLLCRHGARTIYAKGDDVDGIYKIEKLRFEVGPRIESTIRGSQFLMKVSLKANDTFTGYYFCIAEMCSNRLVLWNNTQRGGSHQLKRHQHVGEAFPSEFPGNSGTGGEYYANPGMNDIFRRLKSLVILQPTILLDALKLATRRQISSVIGIVGGRLASDGRPLSVPSPVTVCTRFKADNMCVKDKNKYLLTNVINGGARVMLCVDMKSYGRFDRLHGTLVAVYYWDIQQKCSNTIILDMDLRLKPYAIDEGTPAYEYVRTVLREYDITIENDIYATICTRRNQPCAKVLNEVLDNIYTTVNSSGGKCVQYECVVASLLNKVDLSFASTISDVDVVASDEFELDNWPNTVTKCAVVVNWIKETYPNDSCVQALCAYDRQTMMSAMAMYKTLMDCHSYIIEIISGCDDDDICDKPEINWYYNNMNENVFELAVDLMRPVELIVTELSENIPIGDVDNILSIYTEDLGWGTIMTGDWLRTQTKSCLFVDAIKRDICAIQDMVHKIVVELDSVQNCPPVRPLKIEDVIDDISVTRLYEDMKAHQSIMHDILLIHCFNYSGAN